MPSTRNYVMHDQLRDQVWQIMNINLARLEPLNSGLMRFLLEPPTGAKRIRNGKTFAKMKSEWIKQAVVELKSACKAFGSDLKAAIS